jgi:Tfp pilus assembly protein PilN
MIKINLVQAPAEELPLKAQEPVQASRKNGVYALASVVVCFGIVGLFYWGWNHEIAGLNARIGAARVQAARLSGIEAQNRRYEADLAQIENHVRVIESLETSRTGPQELMTKLGNMVDGISGLYLLSLKSGAGQLAIDGQADRVSAIADFIGVLQSNPSFQKIELHQVFEDDQNNRVNFKFDLVCLYTPPVETAASTFPVAPTGNSRRPPGRSF